MTQIVTTLKISAGGNMTWSKEIIADERKAAERPCVQCVVVERAQDAERRAVAEFLRGQIAGLEMTLKALEEGDIGAIPVRFDDPGVQGFAIRCEQPQEETEADIADFADSFLRGDMTALDEDGEDIDYTTITPEQALVFARREIEEGDWGRDGWAVSWVRWESPSDRPDYDRLTFVGDREEMTLFPSVEAARAFIDAHLKDTNDALEIWGIA
jgi:hypothetical protein